MSSFSMICESEGIADGRSPGIRPLKNRTYDVLFINRKSLCYDDETYERHIEYEGEGQGDQVYTKRNAYLKAHIDAMKSNKENYRMIKLFIGNGAKKSEKCKYVHENGRRCGYSTKFENELCAKHGGDIKMSNRWSALGIWLLMTTFTKTKDGATKCIFVLEKYNQIRRAPLVICDTDEKEE